MAFDQILNQTPGLLFTLVLISFTIGMFIDSILTAKKENEQKPTQLPTQLPAQAT